MKGRIILKISVKNYVLLKALFKSLNRKIDATIEDTAQGLIAEAERRAKVRVLDPTRKPNNVSGKYYRSIKGSTQQKSGFYIAELSSDVPYSGAIEFGHSRKKSARNNKKNVSFKIPQGNRSRKGFRVLGDSVEEAVLDTERILKERFKKNFE